ncbi:MAG: molybdopterin-dependent oxidoreductase [Deltaproteobacteria bacterium]|nr:molybdopterin-dependent oxidoreductase [Deltaproteobacteria bacterium]
MTVHRSACPLDCPDACSLAVTVHEGGRVVEITGDERAPITNGFVCGKVRKLADHLYGADRILHPMIHGERVSWETALDHIAAKLTQIRDRWGGAAILPYHYGGSNGWLTEGALATRFFRRIRASILDRTYCASATSAAQGGVVGAMPGVMLEDYAHAKLIVVWGTNLHATGIHLVPVIERAREAGAKLVVVDPRATPLARRADLHIPLRPGTDLPVALSIIHAMFERGHADLAFLERHAAEVDVLRSRAADWSLEAAAREAAIDPALLDRFVELYAASSPAAIRIGYGPERNRNGGSAIAAIMAIAAVGGKFGVRGGGFTMSNGDSARWKVTPEAAIAEEPSIVRHVNMGNLASALATLTDPPIAAVFVYNCNPAATAPDQVAVLEQLRRDDVFVVCHEQVWTDTARLADVVLPSTAMLEHREISRGYGTMRLYDARPVATPPGEARSNNQVFAALLDRMGLAKPGDPTTDDELAAAIFASHPAGAELRAQLDSRGIATPSVGEHPIPFVDVFPSHPDRKIHLVPGPLDREAGGLYTYKRDPATSDYPLALISPALATQISSTFGQLRTAPAQLELAAADAAARGIANGDAIRVWNARGEIRCTAKITSDLQPGTCLLPKGLWHKHTSNGHTSNAVIPEGFADLGGQVAWNDARVQVSKVETQTQS